MLQLFTPRRVHAVSELISQVKKINEQHFAAVWVQGEIKGFTRAASGHLYFSLSDGLASLRVVMFRASAALLRFGPQEGQKILCRGQVSVYAARGEMQLLADTLEPLGVGAEALALAELKERLSKEGLFAHARKRPLPLPPKRILLITSLQGAALHDFLKVIKRQPNSMEIKIWPALVQGRQALESILAAFKRLNGWPWPQVVVLTRGGGSASDLAVFNQEALARAVGKSPVPVLAAVGHEIDVSLCELAADLHAATPTAAAEILLAPWAALAARLEVLEARLQKWGQRSFAGQEARLMSLSGRLRHPGQAVKLRAARLHACYGRLERGWQKKWLAAHNSLHESVLHLNKFNPRLKLAESAARLAALQKRGQYLMHGRLQASLGQWRGLSAKLAALNPLAVLTRGYALATTEQGAIIKSHTQAREGDTIKVRLAEGWLTALVKETKP